MIVFNFQWKSAYCAPPIFFVYRNKFAHTQIYIYIHIAIYIYTSTPLKTNMEVENGANGYPEILFGNLHLEPAVGFVSVNPLWVHPRSWQNDIHGGATCID